MPPSSLPAALAPFSNAREPGLSLSPIGWGMWRLDQQADTDTLERLAQAVADAGVTLFDTADIYGFNGHDLFGDIEARFGAVLAQAPGLRARIVLATKAGVRPSMPYDSSAAYLISACEASLTRLRTDHVDLFQVHRPDHLAHPHEIAEACVALHKAGKITSVGVSNYSASMTRALMAAMPGRLATFQPEFSPLAIGALDDGVLDLALETGVRVLSWSPLAGGRILNPGDDARANRVAAALDKVAEAHQSDRAGAALAFALAHPAAIIPLVGSQNPARIKAAMAASLIRLSRAEWYDILVASRGAPMP